MPEGPVEVPELLVYDDSQQLRAPFDVDEARFVDGRRGRALHVDSTYALVLPTEGWDANRGTVEFWFRPHWSAPRERNVRFLFNVRSGETDEVGLFYDGRYGALMGIVDRGAQRYRSASAPIELRAFRWYHVTLTWNSNRDGSGSFACAIDGEIVLDFGGAFAARAMPPAIYVGWAARTAVAIPRMPTSTSWSCTGARSTPSSCRVATSNVRVGCTAWISTHTARSPTRRSASDDTRASSPFLRLVFTHRCLRAPRSSCG